MLERGLIEVCTERNNRLYTRDTLPCSYSINRTLYSDGSRALGATSGNCLNNALKFVNTKSHFPLSSQRTIALCV